MERLLEDAGKLANTKFDISSYADVIQAIHTIQENLDITGTTAKEAADTIEGSMNSTKAALDNLITGFARSDADIDKLMGDVEENVKNLAKNAIPVAEKAFVTMAKTAISAGKEIAKELPALVRQATTDVHKMIKETFGDSADTIFGIEAALKAAAAAFVAFKAAAYVADVVDKIKALNTALQGTVTLSEAMKAANLANPWVLAATAIAAATVGLKSWIDAQTDAIQEAVDGYDLLNDAQKEAYDGVTELSKATRESRDKWKENESSIEANAAMYRSLTDDLFALDSQEQLSNESKARMKTIIDQLNGSIEGLNIELNEETGHLKTQREEIDKLVSSYEKQAKTEAAQQRLTELYKEQFKAESNLKKVEKERIEGHEKLTKAKNESAEAQKKLNTFLENHNKLHVWGTETEREYQQLKQNVEETNQALVNQKNAVGDLDGKYVEAAGTARQIKEEMSSMTDILTEEQVKMAEIGGATTDTTNVIATSYDALKNAFQEVVESTEGFWLNIRDNTHVLSLETAEQVGEIIDAYDELYNKQYEAIAKSVDLYKGFEADTSVTYNDLLKNLQQSEFYLNDWTTAIDQLQAKVDKGLMSQQFLDSLKDMGLDSWNIVYNMNHATEEQLKQYSDLWVKTNKEVKESTDKLTADQKESAEKQISEITGIADASMEEYKKAFANVGVAIGDGLVDGIHSKIKEAQAEIKEMGEGVIQIGKETLKVNSPSEEFREIGNYVVDGLIMGIAEKRAVAEEAIRKLSQRLIKATEEEFEISSPSKVMKKLGGYVSEGFALGIEENEERAKDAWKSISNTALSNTSDEISAPMPRYGKELRTTIRQEEPQQKLDVQTLTTAFKDALKDLVSGDIEVTGTLDGEKLMSVLFPKIDAMQGKRAEAAIRGYAQ